MKRQGTSGFGVQPNLRRLLLACMAALVVLAFARPGLAQDLPGGKTAEQPKVITVATTATAASGFEADPGMAALSSPQSGVAVPSSSAGSPVATGSPKPGTSPMRSRATPTRMRPVAVPPGSTFAATARPS
jgi:hypothetical protein